ncbi:hypothetical protein SALBM135S_03472 [Streptomyces alboniger]
MSGILPDVFGSGERDVQGVRNEIGRCRKRLA